MGNNDCVLFLTKQQKKVPDAKGSSSSGPTRIVVFRHFVKASIYCCKGSDTLAVFEEEPTQDVGSDFFLMALQHTEKDAWPAAALTLSSGSKEKPCLRREEEEA